MKHKLSLYTNQPTPYQLDFCAALSKEFGDFSVVYYTDKEPDRDWSLAVDEVGYRIKTLQNSRLVRWLKLERFAFHFDFSIFKVVKRDKADHVILSGSYWCPNTIIALLMFKWRGVSTSFWGEPVFPSFGFVSSLSKQIRLFPIFKWTDFIIGIGQQAVDSYRSLGYKQPIYNIPYNIDVTQFSSNSVDENFIIDLRTQLGIKDEYVFITSGSLTHRKGMDVLIDAFAQLDVPAKLIILGSGPLEAELIAQAKGLEVIFAGMIAKDELPNYFALADCFAFASRYDGWAVVVNEAIAAGLPIISSRTVGATVDLLLDTDDNIVCESEDVEAFALAMNNKAIKGNEHVNESLLAKVDSKACAQKLNKILAKYV